MSDHSLAIGRAARKGGLLAGLLGLIMTVSACGRGDLSGNVYLATQGGFQAKRGLDIQVFLVPETAEFQKSWAALQADYSREVAPVLASYEEASRLSQAWSEEVSKTLGSGRYESAMTSSKRASEYASEEARTLTAVQQQYRERAAALLKQQPYKTSRTDVNGAYSFTGLSTGRYVMFAEWQTVELIASYSVPITHTWAVSVEVTRGPNKLDLSGSNVGVFKKS